MAVSVAAEGGDISGGVEVTTVAEA